MASSLNLLLFSFVILFFSLSHSQVLPPPTALLFPIRKNTSTLQYYTTISMATRTVDGNVNVVIDLGSQYLWFDCDNYNSSSYRPIRCGTTTCNTAKSIACIDCNSPPRPGCTNNTCGVFGYNPFDNSLVSQGLGEDLMFVTSTDGRRVLYNYESPHFLFSCASSFELTCLASGTKGMIGLSNTTTALHTQLALAFMLPHKFALCLPSIFETGLGNIFIGGGPYYMSLSSTEDISKDFMTTPLIINPVSTAPIYSEGDPSDEYFIDVKSIRVDQKNVSSFNTSILSIDKNGVGGTKLSTTTNYTVLHTSIYKAFVNDFVKAAALKKIKRVKSVAPFGACFSSRTIPNTPTGPDVPNIDLVLEGKNVKWRIYGANSMVEVKKNVLCLGFLDGGSEPRTSIVLGGHQLENYLIEFDLVSSKLHFSPSLLLRNATCATSRFL